MSDEPSVRHEEVAVIGCGLMGAAIARALAAGGHDVTVWNRTAERARELRAERISPAMTVADAVRSADLVFTVTSTYDTTREALATAKDLSGKTVVNLCTGTPRAAAEMAEWTAGREAGYLDGAIIAFPEFIGETDALLVYAGSSALWKRHEEALLHLGGKSCLLAEDPGSAKVLDVATIGAFYTVAVSAYVDAATYALSQGVPADVLREATRLVLRTLGHSTKEAVAAIETGDFATAQATLDTYRIGVHSMLASMKGAGHPAHILATTLEQLETAHQAGLGDLGLYAQSQIVAPKLPGRT